MSCPICITDMTSNKLITNCGHSFHDFCLLKYFSYTTNRTCPLCRRTVLLCHKYDSIVNALAYCKKQDSFDIFDVLIFAVQRQKMVVFCYLVKNHAIFGLDLNQIKHNTSLLELTIILHLYDESKLLIENGSTVNRDVFILSCKYAPEFALWLLESELISKSAYFLYYYLARQCVYKHEYKILKRLLKLCKHPKFIVNFIEDSTSYNNVIFESVLYSEYNVFRELLKYVYDVNSTNVDGETLLHYACKNNKYMLVRELIIRKANVNALILSKNESVLAIACRHSSKHIIRLLLLNGSDLNRENKLGDTSFDIAGSIHRFDVCQLLLNYGFDINQKNNRHSFTPLMKAILSKNVQFVQFILQNANLDIEQKNKHGVNAVYMAYTSNFQIMETLISKDIKINSLHMLKPLIVHSVIDNNYKACKLLLNYKADPNQKDCFGKTALNYACEEQKTDIITLLLDNGAYIMNKDNSGRSILEICKQKMLHQVLILLYEHVILKFL